MAETVSPKPTTAQKQRAPVYSRLQSPTSPFVLMSSDDQLERAQARAAHAATIRRKNVSGTAAPPPLVPDPCLSKEQIIELYRNCIKLASENKINQKNTWDLKLLDHLSEIIKVEGADAAETNFQKASCALEAGVKIYSLRVDSVHAEAYKVLGGINRAGQEDEQETIMEGDNINKGQDGGHCRKESERKISPLSTLESSFEVHNVKKFDVAFAVDPLYHQTSAQFDEGGAKDLLLNNLGMYGGCQVLFDSLEVPGRCRSHSIQNDCTDMIDISFAQEYIEQMVKNMLAEKEISPTLSEIVCQFDEDNQRSSQTFNVDEKYDGGLDTFGDNDIELDGNSFGNNEDWTTDLDNKSSVGNECPTFRSHHEENDSYTSYKADVDDRFEKVAVDLLLGLEFTSEQNAWAGPDHWKYRKSKGSEDVPFTESGSDFTTKRTKNKNLAEVDIDFTESLDKELLDIFAPPKNLKSLLLHVKRAPWDNNLPEDCHYQPEDLVKLFLLPNVTCLGKRRRKFSDNNSWQQSNDFDGPLLSWDNRSAFSGQYDDGYVHSDVEDSDAPVSQPRQVNKVEVQYDKTSKQVDVHALKEPLWNHIQESIEMPETVCEGMSFKHMLATFPFDCQSAAQKDISPHLCFICLLHLASEHGLRIHDCPSLDELSIHLPFSFQNMGSSL